jgi:hypothetical protein
MLATGGGFSRLKNMKFPNKKVLFSIYSDISLYKKGTFHLKKGHF